MGVERAWVCECVRVCVRVCVIDNVHCICSIAYVRLYSHVLHVRACDPARVLKSLQS